MKVSSMIYKTIEKIMELEGQEKRSRSNLSVKFTIIPIHEKLGVIMNSYILSLLFFLYIGCGTWAGNPTGEDPNSLVADAEVQLNIVGSSNLTLAANTIEVTDTNGAVSGHIKLTQASLGLKDIRLKNRSNDNGHDKKIPGTIFSKSFNQFHKSFN